MPHPFFTLRRPKFLSISLQNSTGFQLWLPLSVISFQPKFSLLKLYKKVFELRIDLRPQMLYTKDRIQEFAEAPVHELKKI